MEDISFQRNSFQINEMDKEENLSLPNKNLIPLHNDAYNKSTFRYGILFTCIGSICCAFGNALEPNSIVTYIQSYFFLLGFYYLCDLSSTEMKFRERSILLRWDNVKAIVCFILITCIGVVYGFGTLLGFPKTTFVTLASTYGLASAVALCIVFFALLPQFLYTSRFPRFPLTPFIYPAGYVLSYHTIIGRILSCLPVSANAMLDFVPLTNVAALTGISGLEWVVAMSCSLLFHYTIYSDKASKMNLFIMKYFFGFLIILLITTGFIATSERYYQKNVADLIVPLVPMQCVFAQDAVNGTSYYNDIWKATEQSLIDGDSLVMWSEEAVDVFSDNEEQELLTRAQELALKYQSGYIGITFLKMIGNIHTNHFALITEKGELAWNYKKAHPVPLIEGDITSGPNVLPTYYSSFFQLNLGGAICFDMCYPSFIQQAGFKDVDLLLQPSWTWNAIDVRHFEDNSIRALENGFTLFRCSSDGESGVTNHKGQIQSRRISLHQPIVYPPYRFLVPMQSHVKTFYSVIGFIFEYLNAIFSILSIVLILLLEYSANYGNSNKLFSRFQKLYGMEMNLDPTIEYYNSFDSEPVVSLSRL